MKLAQKYTAYLNIIIIQLICLITALASFGVYAAETIPQVSFYDKPLYTFRGKTPHISMPISVEFPITTVAWNYPRVPKDNLPSEITSKYPVANLGVNYNTRDSIKELE